MIKKKKFKLAFLSGVLLHAALVGVNIIPSFAVYILSYIAQKESQGYINLLYGNLLSPIFSLFSSFMGPISGVVETRLGSIWAMIIGGIIVEIALTCIYFQQNLVLLCGFIILLGIGSGLCNGIPTKNAVLFYPKNKGLITSSFTTITALFSIIFTFMGEVIINPEKYSLKEDEKFYPKEVGDNTKKYYLIAGAVEPLFLLFAIFSFSKYDPSIEEDNQTEKKTEEKSETEIEETKETEPEVKNSETPTITGRMKIQKALRSGRFWKLCLMSILINFGVIFCSVTLRTYIAVIGLDGDAVRLLTIIPLLCSCFMIPAWATLTDKFGFVIMSKIIIIPMFFEEIFLGIFLDNPKFLVIGICLFLFSSIGFVFCLLTHLMTVFSVKYYLHIGGVLGIINALLPLALSTLSIVLSNYFEGREIAKPYKMIFLISSCLVAIGFVISLFETNQPFDFESEIKKDLEKNPIGPIKEKENQIEMIGQTNNAV